MKRVAVLDPGRCKCGLVLADLQLGLVREGHVLAPEAVEPWLEQWNQDEALDRILIGDGTGSRAWIKRLERLGHLTRGSGAGNNPEGKTALLDAVASAGLAKDAAGRAAHSTGGSGCCCSFGDA